MAPGKKVDENFKKREIRKFTKKRIFRMVLRSLSCAFEGQARSKLAKRIDEEGEFSMKKKRKKRKENEIKSGSRQKSSPIEQPIRRKGPSLPSTYQNRDAEIDVNDAPL